MNSTGRTTRAFLRSGSLARAASAAALLVALVSLPFVAASAENERGAALFDLCTQCHGEQAEGKELYLAPSIAGMAEWYVTSQLKMFQQGARGLHHADVGGMRMVPMSRYLTSEADLKAVAAYVAGLPATKPTPVVHGGDAAKGQAAYALCASCHGADGKGIAQMNAPRLVGTSDWYLLNALRKYKDGTRGGNSANANAMLMRGMALSLADEQAMKDVVAHINTLAN